MHAQSGGGANGARCRRVTQVDGLLCKWLCGCGRFNRIIAAWVAIGRRRPQSASPRPDRDLMAHDQHTALVVSFLLSHREHGSFARSKSDVSPRDEAIGFTAIRFLIPAISAMQSSQKALARLLRRSWATLYGFESSFIRAIVLPASTRWRACRGSRPQFVDGTPKAHAAARVEAGRCTLPTLRRGDEKRVAPQSGKPYQTRLPARSESEAWFTDGT